MSRRKGVVQLDRVELIDPPEFPKQKLYKKQREGVAYEKRIAKFLQGMEHPVLHGQWIRYWDKFTPEGGAICQPDFIVLPEDECLPLTLIECKLCYRPEANRKLANLYLPLVRLCWPGREVLTAQVFRSIPRDSGLQLDSRLEDLYNDPTKIHRDILEIL